MFTAGFDLGALLFFSTSILNNFCFCGADVAVELPELFCARKDTAFAEIDLLGRAIDFRFDLENWGISFFGCKIGLVGCSAASVAGSGVDGAPRFGAGLRGTKKEAVVVSAFCAIGVTLLAFCDVWVFGFGFWILG